MTSKPARARLRPQMGAAYRKVGTNRNVAVLWALLAVHAVATGSTVFAAMYTVACVAHVAMHLLDRRGSGSPS